MDTEASIRLLVIALGEYLPPRIDASNIYRVTKRVGWVLENATYEKAHQILGELISPDRNYPLHINIIRHGREICVAGMPRCEVCPLTDACEYYQRTT